MSAGTIPVIIAEELVLPFSEFLNWKEFSVSVSHGAIDRLPQILRSIPAHTVERMHRRVCQVFERHFADLNTVLSTALDVYRYRYTGEGYSELFWNRTGVHHE
jgi:glucuronyl/N-acetylglucosaminyl transferase EXT2